VRSKRVWQTRDGEMSAGITDHLGPAPPPAGLRPDREAVAASMAPPPRDERLRGIRNIRGHLANGMLITGTFQIGLLGITAARGFAAAAFVSRADYGLWGLIGLTLWTAVGLKTLFGAGERYVQQSDEHQEQAFQRAFTIELIFTAAMVPVAVAAAFAVALISGDSSVLAPGLVLLLLLPATALQFPISVFYRRLDFRRQRILQAIEPVISAAAIIGLAAAGAGYWSFVIGSLCGSWTLALVLVLLSPYPLKLRYERGTLRQYLGFSLPLLVSGIAVLGLFYAVYLVGDAAIGIAGLGVFTLAGNLVQFTDQADTIITETLYPAVCAVKDRVTLLSEIFVKSNRLSLMWAVPFGVGIALFAPDLVHVILGPRWRPAVPLLQILGLVTAVHHVGYNWGAFVKARGRTWPLAISAVATTSVVIAAAIPLMYWDHLVGLGLAFALGEVVGLTIRGIWLSRFFTGVSILSHLLRAFAPTACAAIPVLLLQLVSGSEQSAPVAFATVALYVALTVSATWILERPLLNETASYFMQRRLRTA